MLQKLRSRHPVDVPAEGFGRSTGLLIVISGLALLFVIAPLGVAFLAGALRGPVALGVAFGALAVVLLVGAAIGKPGVGR